MKCIICESKTHLFDDLQLNKKFYHCKNCELIFLTKDFFVNQENEKKQYDNHNNSFEDTGYVNMFENFLDFFINDINPKTALDFGCGPGPVLYELLKRRGIQTDCYDKFYQTEEVYKDKKYDLITSTEVFEHLDDPKSVLNFFKEHLHVGGTVALMTLFHTNNENDFLKWWYRRDPTHITFFTPKSIEVMGEECGFEIVKHDSKRVIVLRKI